MESCKVVIESSSLVAPREATPTKGLWLSPLDQVLANRGHTPLVFFYRSGAALFDVARLKEAIAKALVPFYPLAGRLTGRAEISCNGEGALFVVARSDLTDEDVDFSKPSPELRRMFVPRVEPSSLVLATQVTFLKSGGVAVGMAFHHAAVDGTSAFHFMQMWSAFYKDGDRAAAAVEPPCHDRTLLRARSPPTVHPDALSVLRPKVTFSEPSGPTATQVFAISGEQLATLKRLCGGASTFCSVSALVWQCVTVARRLPPDAEARLSFPANVRRHVRPPLPGGYFGNALIHLGASGAARDIASEALASVTRRIRGTIARMDDELVRSAIDYLEVADKDSRPLSGTMPETELRITSWLGMPVYDVDFGCRVPPVMSRAESARGGFVYVMDDGHHGVRVVMCMEAANIEEFGRLLYRNIANTSSKL